MFKFEKKSKSNLSFYFCERYVAKECHIFYNNYCSIELFMYSFC